jgi:hypothetical protein
MGRQAGHCFKIHAPQYCAVRERASFIEKTLTRLRAQAREGKQLMTVDHGV